MKIAREYFGEGIAILHEYLYVLTYRKQTVLRFPLSAFAAGPEGLNAVKPEKFPFPAREGWGLTTDGCNLLATTGAAELLWID